MSESTTVIPYQIDIEGIARFFFDLFTGHEGDYASFLESVMDGWYIFSIISFAVSALLLFGTVYAMMRFAQLGEVEQDMLREAEHAYRHTHVSRDENPKWRQITEHVSSDNPSDWRLAIIEADIMLDELLTQLGYTGTSIGEKLKHARPEIFRSLQDAWDAHKIRNEIAHRGSDFVLTKRTTQEAITKYEHVFNEFKYL